MSLSKSLTQPLRQGQLTVGSGWRAYFAPFNQALAVSSANTSLGPSIYDFSVFGRVTGVVPGFFDLGYVRNVKMTPSSKTGNIATGYRGAIRAKYRGEVGEKLSFELMEMSRMAQKITTGTQMLNILKTASVTPAAGPMSATGVAAVAIGALGYQPTGLGSGPTAGLPTLFVPSGSGALFPVGSMIVCDQDYTAGNFGFVGDAGANVFPGAVTDVDYIRKTSDYVASVIGVVPTASGSQDALILSGPFVGGGNNGVSATPFTSPTAGAKVQQMIGYTSREGGTTITEWTGLFILDTVDGSQLMFYYPRIAPDQFGGLNSANVEGINSLQTTSMTSSFDAMAYDDPLDGETVVRYFAYFPHPNTNPQI